MQLYTVCDIVHPRCPRNLILRLSGGVTLLMWILRYVVFDLQESSKYLVAKGRDEEAIKVCRDMAFQVFMNPFFFSQALEHIARVNGKTITLTVEKLRAISGDENKPSAPLTNKQIFKKSFSSFSL